MRVPLAAMAFFQRHPPTPLYRGTILLACLAFLLGVAGIFYFKHQDQRGLPPEGNASVLVHGAENDALIEVVAEWEEYAAEKAGGGGRTDAPSARREIGRKGSEAGIYLVREAPPGVPLELIVYSLEGEGRRELHRQLAILTYGQSIYTAIPRGPDPGR